MTLYAIFDPKPGRTDLPRAVPEGFSWFAAILPPVFALRHGLWLIFLAYCLKVFGLIVIAMLLGPAVGWVLYLLVALWFGLAAGGMRRFGLTKSGWTFREDRVAPSADLARLEAMQ